MQRLRLGRCRRLCNGVRPRLLGLARGFCRHGFRRGRCGTLCLRLACGFCGRGFRQCRNGSRGAGGWRLRLARGLGGRGFRRCGNRSGSVRGQRRGLRFARGVYRAGFGRGDRGALRGRRLLLRARKSRCAECNRESSGREDKPANHLKSPLDRSIASKKMRTIPVVAILVRFSVNVRGFSGAPVGAKAPRACGGRGRAATAVTMHKQARSSARLAGAGKDPLDVFAR